MKTDSTFTRFFPVAALTIACSLWGTSFIAMRIVVRVMEPHAVIWIRMAVATALILPFLPSLLYRKVHRRDFFPLCMTVLFQPCLYFLFESNALRFTTSTQAGIISSVVPILVAVGALLFLAEPMSRRTWTGLFVSVAGVVVMTVSGDGGGAAENPVLGNALELAAMFCAAANMLLVKRLSGRYGPWTLTALQTLAGFLFFLPGAFTIGRISPSVWSPQIVFSLVFLGSCVTLGAFGLFNWGMSRARASDASSFVNLIPVIAGTLGWTFLGESLNRVQLVSALIVVVGVMYSQDKKKVESTGALIVPSVSARGEER